MRRAVERRGVEDGDAVPTRLHLHREVPLEALRGRRVLEHGLERLVVERGAVDVARDPVVVKDGGALRGVSGSERRGGGWRTISSLYM